MLSLHNITHAVTLAVIATLLRKHIQLKYDYEDLEMACQSCHINAPDTHHDIHDLAELDRCRRLVNEEHQRRQTDYEKHDANPDSVKNIDDSSVLQASNLNKGHQSSQTDYEKLDENSVSVDDSSVPSASNLSSSVWCYGNGRSDRFCHFHNLCYFSEYREFVFVHGEQSVINGLPEEHFNILDLSSVSDHNIFFFSFVDVLSKPFQNVTVEWINETSLIISRFKPDNLMHVLHDDVLPLHHTLKWMTFFTRQLSSLDVQFVFMDDWEESDFDNLYETLSDHRPIRKLDLDNAGQVVCFADSFVGISKETTWYQYGFTEFQGPKPVTESISNHIHDAVQQLLIDLPSEVNTRENGHYLVLVSRKQNRLILNEAELSVAIAEETKLRVISVSFETHSIQDMIHIVSGSRGITGMHGSLMSLSLFLKPGSIIIELFPFAVNPVNYTPYKSLAMIKGMDIIYKAWANTLKDNTIMHPEYEPEYGGINHLPDSEQETIKSQTEVPTHLCCSDPSWLFHIYQDTMVEVHDIAVLAKTALEEGSGIKQSSPLTVNSIISPGIVTNVTCQRDVIDGKMFLTLAWEHPWNILYIEFDQMNFEVWLQTVSTDKVVSFLLGNQTTYVVPSAIEADFTYHVWVRCVIDEHINGQFGSALHC